MKIVIKIMNEPGHLRNVPAESEISIVSSDLETLSECLEELELVAEEVPKGIKVFVTSTIETLTKK